MPDLRSIFRRPAAAFAVLALAAASLAACGDGTGPDRQKRTDELTFLRFDVNAPALAQTTVTFWAKKGDDRRGRLYFVTPLNAPDTAEFMTFRVREESLLRYPNGRLFADGDSIQITITLLDPLTLAVNMQPAGLQFSSREPAELKFDYDESDDDYDDDGDVDDDDLSAERRVSIWRQELPGQPWVRLSSRVEVSLNEVEADIISFTSYALAF